MAPKKGNASKEAAKDATASKTTPDAGKADAGGKQPPQQEVAEIDERAPKMPKVTEFVGRAAFSASIGWLTYRADPNKNKSGNLMLEAQQALEDHLIFGVCFV